jgi:hypothetical protein
VNGGQDTAWIDDLEVTVDNTTWTTVVDQTAVGATSAAWTPATAGDQYKVRVRADYGAYYGNWDESDGTFRVVPGPTGDIEPDGDLDLVDFHAFQECLGATTGPCLDTFDLVLDGVIDLNDYAVWATRMTGPR